MVPVLEVHHPEVQDQAVVQDQVPEVEVALDLAQALDQVPVQVHTYHTLKLKVLQIVLLENLDVMLEV